MSLDALGQGLEFRVLIQGRGDLDPVRQPQHPMSELHVSPRDVVANEPAIATLVHEQMLFKVLEGRG